MKNKIICTDRWGRRVTLVGIDKSGFGARAPHFAVLLAAYNGSQWIDEQIISILNQKGVQVSIIISVDLSTDLTYEKCSEWLKKDNRVRLLDYGRRFGGAAQNFFRLAIDVDVSCFDAVALSDQDDVWLPDKLLAAWAQLSPGGFDAYSSNVTAFWSNDKKLRIKKSYRQRTYDHFYEAAGPGCTYVFSTRTFFSIQVFLRNNYRKLDGVALHDWLFYAFCREHGFKWIIDDKFSVLYRQHSSNQIGANATIKGIMRRVNMVQSRWYRDQVTKVACLVAPAMVGRITSRIFIIIHYRNLRRRLRDSIALLLSAITAVF